MRRKAANGSCHGFADFASRGFLFLEDLRIIEPMRYLGIDYGIKRIGIAVSDDERRLAFPAGVIINRSTHGALKQIVEKIKKENAGVVVVGLPIGLDGKETDQTQATRSFIALLKKVALISVETENEMLTSRMAAADGMEGGHIDASSAAIILQSYLDRKTLSTKL